MPGKTIRNRHIDGKIIEKAVDVERSFYIVECPENTLLQRNHLLFMALCGNRRKCRKVLLMAKTGSVLVAIDRFRC